MIVSKPASSDRDLGPLGADRLVLVLVGRVEVRRLRLELGGARVDRLGHGDDSELLAAGAHVGFLAGKLLGERSVGETQSFGVPKLVARDRRERPAGEGFFRLDHPTHAV
jgi:hypothetical protein